MNKNLQKILNFKFSQKRNIFFNYNLKVNEANDSKSTKDEINHHANLATDWWNKQGPMKALHALNELRVPFIRDGIVAKNNLYFRENKGKILDGVNILDVGCGGGILSESLANLHANVTGIDLGEDLITVAKEHLRSRTKKYQNSLKYEVESIEKHAQKNESKYDAVILSEVIEHINDKVEFIKNCVETLRVGGSIFITTPNKTILSRLFVIEFAEKCTNVVPKGTHTYEKFISPLDLQRILDSFNCNTIIVNGMCYDFLSNKWKWTSNLELCYALQAVKIR
ncbi:ubiquinone biosynthesis O-methyltransferase, mitochondrial-like [Condylostylus longicornis]|uniref:ubiquinone biosynthesis O-methyltransferase, mitochondrial-like n=1 Tax=Condylostylus longicornis TaxID=2530218 RepID=UPI00244E1CC7|nr:ubiquinone biosynthesis O-methyltransferase, mitochondrial-like [Condylostylus longicornis]